MANTPASRHVVPHPTGWAVQKPGGDRASSVHDTQQQAIDAGRKTLKNLGGGELNWLGPCVGVRGQTLFEARFGFE